MNQYLLLRDNKQSGPYTVDELAAKGLKAYDLVWLEGKSAAWRYPSEIAELKPFAPVVEEQPYDRFYKKAQEESHPALDLAQKKQKTTTPVFTPVEEPVKNQPAYAEAPVDESAIASATADESAIASATADEPEIAAQPAVIPKKIYVTLPGNVSKKETKKPAASFSQSISTIAEERPVVKEPVKDPEPLPDLYTQLQENERAHPKRTRRSVRPVMYGLVAACILLFGVIIGLYISNMKQNSQNQALEDMVKRIQERDRNRNNNSTPAHPQNLPVQEAKQPAVDSSDAFRKQPVENDPKLHISTVSRKGITNPAPEGTNAPIVNTASQEEDKITYQQAAIESTRKNIHQMLLVENSNFKTGLMGGISNLHMTLSNNSRFPLDQVEIEIKYFGPEQKLVKTQKLLFNDLAPGEQKTLEAPRTTRGITIDYAITRIQSKVLGLAQHRF